MKKQAILVIDMQKGLVLGAYRQDELVATLNGLIARGRAAEVPVVFVQHNHATFEPMMRGSRGWEIYSELDRRAEDPVVEKEACDAFYETALDATLKNLGVEELLVTGLQTEYCVDTACRAALSHGYDVVLVEDGHSTGDSDMPAAEIVAHHNAVLANMVHPSAKIRVLSAGEITIGH
jgi:nicotinamidase-related amidase